MAEKLRSMRVSDERWEWLGEEARRRGPGWSRTRLIGDLVDVARAPASAVNVARVSAASGTRSQGPIRVDTPAQAAEWAMDRQRRLNAAKDRAS